MKEIFPPSETIVYCRDPYEAAGEASALLVVTEWEEFRRLDLGRIRELMANPIIVDGRNIFSPAEVRGLGFEYYSVGRR
jgi:UDPglucose 6-dehydrogenase